MREKRLYGESDDVSTMTVKAWIDQLPELCHRYETQNILNLDELGLFLKDLSRKSIGREKIKIRLKKTSDVYCSS